MLHLFHPALVHFALTFVVVGATLEAWSHAREAGAAGRWGGPMLAAGTVLLVPVIVSGYVAANTVTVSDAARPILDGHERNGWLLLGALVLLQFWKAWHRGRLPQGQRRPYAVALVLAVALAVYGALLGGELVYVWGVGVGEG